MSATALSYRLAAFLAAASAGSAASHTWIGGTPANVQWSNAAQWVGGAPDPANGADDLIFGAVAAAYLTNANDFAADTDFNSLTFSAPGYTITGLNFDLAGGISSTHAAAGITNVLPSIRLLANQSFTVGGSADGVLNLNSLVRLNGNQLQAGGTGTIRCPQGLSGTVSGSRLVKNGSGLLHIGADSSISGTTTINNGTVILSGSLADSSVTLTGAGAKLGSEASITLGSLTVTAGELRPGFSQAGLEGIKRMTVTSGLTLGAAASLHCTLGGTTAGTGYDQIKVNAGSVDPGGAALTVTLEAGYVPNAGDQFVIVEVPGVAPGPAGIFAGKAEGATFVSGGATFRISYKGGDGNDVVLSSVLIPTGVTRVWGGGGANANWTNPANWLTNTAPVRGDNIAFPQTAARKTNTNDFPPDTVFNQLRIYGADYVLSGNQIRLANGADLDVTNSGSPPKILLPVRAAADCALVLAASTLADVEFSGLIDNGGFALTFENRNDYQPFLRSRGQITGSGPLIKSGTGAVVWVPAVQLSFSGPLNVNEGNLSIQGVVGLGRDGAGSETNIDADAMLQLDADNPTVVTETFRLSGAVTAFGTNLTIAGPVIVGAVGATIYTANQSSEVMITGPVSTEEGAFPLTMGGSGTATIANAAADFTADGLTVFGGTVLLGKTGAGEGDFNGPIRIGSDVANAPAEAVVRLIGPNQIAPDADTEILANGTLDLGTYRQTINGLIVMEAALITGEAPGRLTLGGSLATVSADEPSEIQGQVLLSNPTSWLVPDGNALVDLRLSGWVDAGAGVRLTKSGAGRLDWQGDTADRYELAATQGTLMISGDCPGVRVFGSSGAVIGGSGTVAQLNPNETTPATLLPGGTVPGLIQTNSLYFGPAAPGGTMRVQINGATAGAGYDQIRLKRSDTVNSIRLDNGTLEVVSTNSFAPGFGQIFTVINNEDEDATLGSFAGAPQGTVFTINGKQLQLSYTGGDGNDVTLTCITLSGITRTWTGAGANGNWTLAANWQGNAAPAAGDRLVFPEGAARTAMANTFTAGTQFDQITFTGGGYTLSGNRLGLVNGISVSKISDPVQINTALDLAQSQEWTLLNGSAFGFVISGPVNLGASDLGFAGTGGAVIQGVISGTGGLTTGGSTRITLSGANTYSGPTLLMPGTSLRAESGSALGSAAAGTTAEADSFLILAGTAAVSEPVISRSAQITSTVPGASLTGTLDLASGTTRIQAAGSAAVLTCTGIISGQGSLTKTGSGKLIIAGTSSNTFTGTTTIADGTVEAGKSVSHKALSQSIVLEGGSSPAVLRMLAAQQLPDTGSMTVGEGDVFDLNGQSETIGDVAMQGGSILTGSGGALIVSTVTSAAADVTSVILGPGRISIGTHRVWTVEDGAAEPDLLIGAVLGTSGGVLTKNGPGHLKSTAVNQIAAIRTEAGRCSFDGTSPATAVTLKDAIVSGTGKTGSLALDPAAVSARIEPGASPGIFSTNSLTAPVAADGVLEIQIQGNTAGTEYDQVKIDASAAADAVDLSGLRLRVRVNDFFPALNSTFRIIDNLSADAVTGTFRGLPQGSTVTAGTVEFTISYTGGDVVLTTSALNGIDRTWTGLGASGNWTLGANWQGGTAPNPGDRLIFPSGAARTSNVNNFPAGTVFGTLDIRAGGYNLSGERIALLEGVRMTFSGSNVILSLPIDPVQSQTWTFANSASTYSLQGAVNLSANDLTISGGFGNVSGEISGSGSLTRTGTGALTLPRTNSFTGPLIVAGGRLSAVAGALGAGPAGTTVRAGATLVLAPDQPAVDIIPENIVLRGSLESALAGVVLAGEVTLAEATAVISVPSGDLTISGRLTGSGSLNKTGAGTLRLTGNASNNYSGRTTINSGILAAAKSIPYSALGQNVEVGGLQPATLRLETSQQIPDTAALYLAAGGTFDLNGLTESIGSLTFTGGQVLTGITTGQLVCGGITVGASPVTAAISGSGRVSLGTDRTWHAEAGTAVPALLVSARIQANEGITLTKTGPGTVVSTGDNSISDITVESGPLQLDGQNPGTSVLVRNGTLSGNGRLDRILTDAAAVSARIAPGASPGRLRGNVLLIPAASGTVLEMELAGTAAGTGYDQVQIESTAVNNSVNLAGATLDLRLTGGFVPAMNASFTLVNNLDGDTNSGEFRNLTEGAAFQAGGVIFRITYAGGDGNDTVVTRIPVPAPAVISFASPRTANAGGPGIPGYAVAFSGTGFAGQTYKLQGSQDLSTWTDLATTTGSVAGAVVFNFGDTANLARRFYRVIAP